MKKSPKKKPINQKELLRMTLVYVGVAAVLLLVYWLKAVLLPFLIAFVLAYLLSPTVDYFERKGFRRVLVILVYFLVVFSLLSVLLAVFIDFAAKEVMILQNKLPSVSGNIEKVISEYYLKAEKYFPGVNPAEIKSLLIENTKKITAEVSKSILGMFSNLINWVSSAAGSLANILLILFSLFYFLKDWEKIKEAIKRAAPAPYRVLAGKLAGSVSHHINKYIKGQIIVASTLGLLAMLGLFLLGFEYYFILGLLTGLFNLIPILGPFIGICVGVVLSFFIQAPFLTGVLTVAGVLLTVQLLDNVLISPFVIGKAVKIHPVTVLVVLSFGGYFLGILGMLISIPFYTTMKFVAAEIYGFHLKKER